MWVPLVFLFIITCHSSASLGVHNEGDAGYRTHFRSPSQFGEQARDWLRGVKERFIGWVLRIVTPNMPRFDVDFRDYGYSDYDYDYSKHTRIIPDPCNWDKLPTDEDEPKRSTFVVDWSYDSGPAPEVTKPVPTESTTESLYYDAREDTRDDVKPPSTTPTGLTTRYEEAGTVIFDTTTPAKLTEQPLISTTSSSPPTTQSVSETTSGKGTTTTQTSDWSSFDYLEPEITTSTERIQTTQTTTSSRLKPDAMTTASVQPSESSTSTSLKSEFITPVPVQTTEQTTVRGLNPDSITATIQIETTEPSTAESTKDVLLFSTIGNTEPELSSTTIESLFSTTENVESELLSSTTETIFKDTVTSVATKASPTSSDLGNTQSAPITVMIESTSYSPTEETVTWNDTPPVTVPLVDYDSDVDLNSLSTTTRAITDLAADDEDQNVGLEMTDPSNMQAQFPTSENANKFSATEEPQSLSKTPTENAVTQGANDGTSRTTNLPPTTTPIAFTTKKAKVEDNEVYKRRTSRKPPRPSSVEVLLPY